MTPLVSSLLIAGILVAALAVILAVMWLDVARGVTGLRADERDYLMRRRANAAAAGLHFACVERWPESDEQLCPDCARVLGVRR